MKKLLILAFTAVLTVTSCSNENFNPEPQSVMLSLRNNVSSKGEIMKVVSAGEVYYMGERWKEDYSEDAQIAQASIKGQEFSRRIGTNQCNFQLPDGSSVYLTQVSGNGQASTYWVTFVDDTGSHTYSNPGLSCNDVRSNLGLK